MAADSSYAKVNQGHMASASFSVLNPVHHIVRELKLKQAPAYHSPARHSGMPASAVAVDQLWGGSVPDLNPLCEMLDVVKQTHSSSPVK